VRIGLEEKYGVISILFGIPRLFIYFICYGLHVRNTDLYVRITTRDFVPRNKPFLSQ
jgi:hypothetical protein